MTGNQLRRLRLNKLHLTQQQLADITGVTRRTIINYEKRGKAHVPPWVDLSLHTLRALS